jgi:hypothetical protein
MEGPYYFQSSDRTHARAIRDDRVHERPLIIPERNRPRLQWIWPERRVWQLVLRLRKRQFCFASISPNRWGCPRFRLLSLIRTASDARPLPDRCQGRRRVRSAPCPAIFPRFAMRSGARAARKHEEEGFAGALRLTNFISSRCSPAGSLKPRLLRETGPL